MFEKSEIDAKIDEEIIRLLAELEQENDKDTKEYASMVEQVIKLKELRNKSSISMETWATIGANILGLVVILNHERAHVIASKAFSLVKKIF